jgi:hypothetical protein
LRRRIHGALPGLRVDEISAFKANSFSETTLSRLKWHGFHSIVLAVSKVEQMESELRKLSQVELRQIREWLDDFIEDELEFTPEFEDSIQRSERDMAAGKAARVREPEHD